jgi:hypothetical protein
MVHAPQSAFAVAIIMATFVSTAGWADDPAQAGACQKTLGQLASNQIDEAVETMFFEAQPMDAQENRAMREDADYEKMAGSLRDEMRRFVENVYKDNDATAVSSRGPVSRQSLGGRIVHLEQWVFDSGRKIQVGCVRLPGSSGRGWVTDVKAGYDKAKVLKDIEADINRSAAR